MENILDYAETFRYSFAERPFSPVDSLLLSQLSYLRFEQLGLRTPQDRLTLHQLAPAARELAESAKHDRPTLQLLSGMGENPRFAEVIACYYVHLTDEAQEMQFAALTFLLSETLAYVAFRGTDDSWVGWRENFNMTVEATVPSHQEAREYLETVATQWSGPLLIGGHSKGGNLAVYAAATASPQVRDQMMRVYNHDGPGFFKEFYHGEGYPEIQSRIHKTVPEFSVVGLLLVQQGEPVAIRSEAEGIAQHDPFSWSVIEGAFVPGEGIHRRARLVAGSLNIRINAMNVQQRRAFISAFFDLVRASGADTLEELAVAVAARGPEVEAVIAGLPFGQRSRFVAILKIFGVLFDERLE